MDGGRSCAQLNFPGFWILDDFLEMSTFLLIQAVTEVADSFVPGGRDVVSQPPSISKHLQASHKTRISEDEKTLEQARTAEAGPQGQSQWLGSSTSLPAALRCTICQSLTIITCEHFFANFDRLIGQSLDHVGSNLASCGPGMSGPLETNILHCLLLS